METIKSKFKRASPYKDDKMNLPVKDVDSAIPFYEKYMGFQLVSKQNEPVKKAILERDEVQMAIAENGGDPTQEGCFFEVDDVENALNEFRSYGLKKEASDIDIQKHGETSWRVFFVVAPDGLCYCMGQKV